MGGEHGTARRIGVAAAVLASTSLIGVLDHLTGPELAFALFYAGPVVFAAWQGGRAAGLLTALAATVMWSLVEIIDRDYTRTAVHFWNALIRGGTFVVISELVTRVRTLVHQQTTLAQQDSLTGLDNSRGFTRALTHELSRSRRTGRPFALAYLDLDNFKQVNDRMGHLAGDELLQGVAQLLRARLRRTDLAARMGGDEFALLLPETDPQGADHVVRELHKALQQHLSQLGLNVGASVGLVCFRSPPQDVYQAIHAADTLMYEVKAAGKHALRCTVRSAPRTASRPPPT